MIRKKILVADGHVLSREWDKALQDGEYDFLVVSSGVEAYETAVFERPCLILMSVRLPELNGDDCCRRLKAHPELRNIPVVLVADGSDAGELDRCRRSGCDDLLCLPVDRQRLIEICRKHPRLQQDASPRVPVQMAVRYGPASDLKKLSNYSINVSAGGLFIETGAPLPVETPLVLEFFLPGQRVPVCCKGRVAWINAPERKQNPRLPRGMGVQFVDLPLEDMRLVRSFIRQELEGAQGR